MDRLFVGEEAAGERVDRFLSQKLGISRSVREKAPPGRGQPWKWEETLVEPSEKVEKPGEEVLVRWARPGAPSHRLSPSPSSMRTKAVVVVNKPRGLRRSFPLGPTVEGPPWSRALLGPRPA
jgi:hypothetical protein